MLPATAALHAPPTSLRTYLTLWAPRCRPFSTLLKQRQRQQMSFSNSQNLPALPVPGLLLLDQRLARSRTKLFPARAKPATICYGYAKTFCAGIACAQISSANITRQSGEFNMPNNAKTVDLVPVVLCPNSLLLCSLKTPSPQQSKATPIVDKPTSLQSASKVNTVVERFSKFSAIYTLPVAKRKKTCIKSAGNITGRTKHIKNILIQGFTIWYCMIMIF